MKDNNHIQGTEYDTVVVNAILFNMTDEVLFAFKHFES